MSLRGGRQTNATIFVTNAVEGKPKGEIKSHQICVIMQMVRSIALRAFRVTLLLVDAF